MCFIWSTEKIEIYSKRSCPCTRLLVESSLGLCNLRGLGACGVGIGCVDTWGLTCEKCRTVWSCVSRVMALVLGVD